ncbi:MAG: sugar transferase, partial [Planctomycetes bacterium]|nr:sugar transferase [Planctomycetota bacterium]
MTTAELDIERFSREISIQTLCDQQTDLRCPAYFCFRDMADRVLALLMLVPALPIIAILVVLVRLTSRGPGIFRQVRVGRGGELFCMYKIRTMRADAEAKTGAVWTKEKDPRITRLGSVLRKTHLDELPQLFNVIMGQMALIGPRPERPEFVVVLADLIPGYYNRLVMRPGITGLAQINLPPDSDIDSVRRKQMLDLEYIRTANVGLDVRMVLCTALRFFGCSGEFAMTFMKLHRTVVLENQRREDRGDQLIADALAEATPGVEAWKEITSFDDSDTVGMSWSEADVRQESLGEEVKVESQRAAAHRPLNADRDSPTTPARLALQRRAGSSAVMSWPRVEPLPLPERDSRVRTGRFDTQRSPTDLTAVFTVDVEDYFHVTAFERDTPREKWDDYPSRVVDNTRRILELLSRHDVRGTFFVLGWVASRFPRLVEEIH